MRELELILENTLKNNLRKKPIQSLEIPKSKFHSILANANTKKIYLLNLDSVLIIDGNTNNIIKKIDVKNLYLCRIDSNTNKIYLQSANPGRITVLDSSLGSETFVLDGSCDSKWKSEDMIIRNNFVIDSNKDLLCLMNKQLNSVFIISNTDNKIVHTIDLKKPEHIFFNPVINTLYISVISKEGRFSLSYHQNLLLFNTQNNKLIQNSDLKNLLKITINPDTNNLYAISYPENIVVIDGYDGKITKTIEIGKPTDIFLNSTNNVYVLSEYNDLVYLIDNETHHIIQYINVKKPKNIITNYQTKQSYVFDGDGKFVYVLDDLTGNLIYTIHLSDDGVGVFDIYAQLNYEHKILYVWKFFGFDSETDSSKIKFFIIDLSKNKTVKIFHSRDDDCDIEVDMKSNRIFLSYFPKKSIFVWNYNGTEIIKIIDVGRGKIKIHILNEINKILYTKSTLFKDYLGIID